MTMRSEFQVHLLNDRGIAAATALGEIFSRALSDIEALVPAGRERDLVITNLQQASFFAKRGIAVDPANQEAHEPAPASVPPPPGFVHREFDPTIDHIIHPDEITAKP